MRSLATANSYAKFVDEVSKHWLTVLRRRSQKGKERPGPGRECAA